MDPRDDQSRYEDAEDLSPEPAEEDDEPKAEVKQPILVEAPAVESWSDYGAPAPPLALGEVSPAGKRPLSTVASLTLVILTVAVVGCLAAAVKLYMDRSAAQGALADAVGSLPGKVALFGAEAMTGQLDTIQQDIAAGRFASAKERLENLRPAPGAAASGTGPASTAPPVNLSPAVEAFFTQHPDLGQKFTGCNAIAKELRDKGQDVQPLRDLRDQIIAAAESGDVPKVTELVDTFAQKVGYKPGQQGPPPGTPPAPPELQAKLQRVGEAFQKARAQGKDLRAAVATMQQAQAAGQAGQYPKADELMDRALRQIAEAKMMPHPPMMRRGPQMIPGGRPGMPGPQPMGLIQGLFGVLQREGPELHAIQEAVEIAATMVLGPNAEQVKTALTAATTSVHHIAQLRSDFERRMRGDQPKQGAGQQSGHQPSGPPAQPNAGESMTMLARQRLVAILRDVRKMPEAQFEKQLGGITNALMGAMVPQRPSAEELAAQEKAGKIKARRGDEAAEARARAKMMIAFQPYQEMTTRKQDTSLVDGYLSRARKGINSGDFVDAEAALDQALKLMHVEPTPDQLNQAIKRTK